MKEKKKGKNEICLKENEDLKGRKIGDIKNTLTYTY